MEKGLPPKKIKLKVVFKVKILETLFKKKKLVNNLSSSEKKKVTFSIPKATKYK